jgi:hypothetical protein
MTINDHPILLIGSNYHPGSPAVVTRQKRSQDSILDLTDVECVNLQFENDPMSVEGFRTLAQLQLDSLKVMGRSGTRKPITIEALDLLAHEAKVCGANYFCWVNADITVLPALLDVIRDRDREAYLFSRTDIDESTSERIGIFHVGIDAFVFRVDYWIRNRWRYRKYILGEGLFDPVFTSITLCHSDGILFNNKDYLLHPNHERTWKYSPFSDWNIFLSAMDFIYLEKWNRYSRYLCDHRSDGFSDDSMEQLQREMFLWPPPLKIRLWQHGRTIKAFFRYHMNRVGWIPSLSYPV